MKHMIAPAIAALMSVSAFATNIAPSDLTAEFDHLKKEINKQVGAQRKTAEKETDQRPLFEVTSEKGKHYLTIQNAQLDKPYIFSATLSRGLGGSEVDSGEVIKNFLFSFHRNGDMIQFLHLNTAFRAKTGTPEAANIKASIPDSPLGSTKIVREETKAGYVVIAVEDLFVPGRGDDLIDITSWVGEHLKAKPSDPPIGLSVARDSGRLENIAAFHSNVEIEVSMALEPRQNVHIASLPDTRLLPIGLHFGLNALPEAGFEPRLSDPRVGYFSSAFNNYSDSKQLDRENPKQAYISRWRLEKVDPKAPVSDVKKPIVWWIDSTVPTQYRSAVREGILSWNPAFERLGFRNALVVKEVDRDMKPDQRAHFNAADASYNVFRWGLRTESGVSKGMPRINPLTGEIYSAAVVFDDKMARVWQDIIHPAISGAEEKVFGLINNAAEKIRIIERYIKNVTAHEIGHTLGLSHNFKGSHALSLRQIDQTGVPSTSLMDYVPIYVPVPGAPRTYYQTKPGSYDLWALAYGYTPLEGTPEQQEIIRKQIAQRADHDPMLAFGTNGDDHGINPDVQTFDFSGELIAFAERTIIQVHRLWNRAAVSTSPDRVPDPKMAFSYGIDQYSRVVKAVLPLIGGVRSDRRPVDEGGSLLRPVSMQEQRAALDFLKRRVFSLGADIVPQRLILRGTSDPSHPINMDNAWSVDSRGADGALFNVPWNVLHNIQMPALQHLYDPSVLNRLLANQQIDPANAFRVSELFAATRASIWSELAEKTPAVGLLRRQLQYEHIKALSQLAKNENAPTDAATLARADLHRIMREAGDAAKRAADPMTHDHLEAMARAAHDGLLPISIEKKDSK